MQKVLNTDDDLDRLNFYLLHKCISLENTNCMSTHIILFFLLLSLYSN